MAGAEIILSQHGVRRKTPQIDHLVFQLRICAGTATVEGGSAQVRDGFSCELDSKRRAPMRLTAQLMQPLLTMGMGDSLGLEMVQDIKGSLAETVLAWNGCLTVYLRRIS